MKRSGQPILILGFVLLIALAGIALVKGKKAPKWFSSSTALRTGSEYDKVLKPAPPETNVWIPLTNIHITTNIGNRITVEYPAPPQGRRSNYAVEKELLVPGRKLPIGEGFISLDDIFVTYGPIPWNKINEWSANMQWRIFKPDFTPLTEEEVKTKYPQPWQRQGDFRGIFPQVRWNFKVEGTTTPRQLDFWSFDGRTHYALNNGRSSSYSKDSFYFEQDLPMWHQGPVELIMDLAYEPGDPVKIPFEEGETYSGSTVALTLARIVPGRSQSWSSNSDGKTNKLDLTFVQDTNYLTTTLIFIATPAASPLPLDIEFVGKNGKTMSNRGGGSSDTLLMAGYEGKPEDCEYILIKPYKKVKRVIFQLPEIPGLPEENRGIDNLFAAKIPYFRATSEWELRNAIERSVQLTMQHASTTVPPGHFPMVLTNTNPAELLKLYQTFAPTNMTPTIDEKKHQIEWDQSSPLGMLRRLARQLFRR